jgi:hypothetical protein
LEFWSPCSPWQLFADEKSKRGLRGLNGSEGIGISSAVSASQQFFNFSEMPVFESLRKE